MVFKSLKEIDKEFLLESPIKIDKYILNGKIYKWEGEFSDVLSPIRIKEKSKLIKKIVGSFPLMDKKIALEILDESFRAYDGGRGSWPCMSIEKRLSYFEKFIFELKKHRKDIIKTLIWEIAKSITDSTSEFDRTIKYIEDSILELKKMQNKSYPKEIGGLIVENKRSSLGVAFVMGPYNYPLNETFANIIPALLMGNTVIVKPPKRGGLVYKYVLDAISKSFPKGVFNVIFGSGREIVEPIMKSGLVDIFAFIGSHSTANLISKMHPKPNRLKSVYGLDAKNVAIVMENCDIDLSVSECLAGTLSFNGQRCTALKLVYVHKKIRKEFLKKYCIAVDNLKFGMPFDNPKLTPVPDERIDFFKDLTKDAISKGAKIINNPKDDIESFIFPKVLFPISKEMKLFKQEQFGPLVPIVEFEDLEEPIDTIFNSHFGQQCSIFGRDPKKIGYLVDFLVNQVSRVNINAQSQRGPDILPFTGRKDSAVGVLSVDHALKTFSIETLVTTKITDENKKIYKEIIEKNYSNFLKNENLF